MTHTPKGKNLFLLRQYTSHNTMLNMKNWSNSTHEHPHDQNILTISNISLYMTENLEVLDMCYQSE